MNKLRRLFRKCDWCHNHTGDVERYKLSHVFGIGFKEPSKARSFAYLCKQCKDAYKNWNLISEETAKEDNNE